VAPFIALSAAAKPDGGDGKPAGTQVTGQGGPNSLPAAGAAMPAGVAGGQSGTATGGDGSRSPGAMDQPGVASTTAGSTGASAFGTAVTAAVAGGAGGASAAANAPTAASAPPAPTTLRQLPEVVRMTIQTQASSGNSVVRIHLSPPELGGVRVQIQETSAGLVARVIADHSSAAQTLQQAAADLRRSLEASGVSLLQLDIGASDGESKGATGQGEGSGGAGGDPAGEGAGGELENGEETTHTVSLSSGAVVDVLA
jgi:flagellar hook-length control protein FliK